MNKSPPQHGFTLIEILVAMTILAIAMAALTQTSGQTTANATYLQERTIGMWVAENTMTELQISSSWAELGTRNGETEMADHRWYWRTIVEKIADRETQEFTRGVTVEVRANSDQKSPSARLVGYIGNPRYSGHSKPTN